MANPELLAETLQDAEVKLLRELSKEKILTPEEARPALWLENKELIKVSVKQGEVLLAVNQAPTYAETGLPEVKLFEKLKQVKQAKFGDLLKLTEMSDEEVKVSIGDLKKQAFIIIEQGQVKITTAADIAGKDYLAKKEKLKQILKKIVKAKGELASKEVKDYEELVKRNLIKKIIIKERSANITELGKEVLKHLKGVERKIGILKPYMIRQGTWKKEKFRRYDVEAPSPRIYVAKRHIVNNSRELIRRIWLDMGFKEMQGPIIESGFWNFDALFVPQDHPAREMQDTFYIKDPKYSELPDKKLVHTVQKVHEDGGTTGSRGWEYKWNVMKAKQLVLRTHTTNLSARTIANLSEKDLPAKFFSVAKVFRNETLDWSHLFDFYQTEGIVVDPDVNFRHLLGYLKQFYNKLGYKKIRIRPAYFPYTEPSVEIEVYDDVHKQWMELGGAGIFRPEVTKPLFGTDIPVLAWGQGLERGVKQYYSITDLRDIYKNDIQVLREAKV